MSDCCPGKDANNEDVFDDTISDESADVWLFRSSSILFVKFQICNFDIFESSTYSALSQLNAERKFEEKKPEN